MMPETWYNLISKSPDTTDVLIYDTIGDWGITAKQFVEDFNGIKTAKIRVRINSAGGSVHDGMAMHNAIKEHPAEVSCRIDGLAASAAAFVAMAGDTVHCSKNAFVMVHNPMAVVFGGSDQLRKEAGILDKLTDVIAQVYVDKSGKTLDECKTAMRDETWFNAKEAKEFGLVDTVGDDEDEDEQAKNLLPAAVHKASLQYHNLPKQLLNFAASAADANVPIHKESPQMATPIIEKDGKHFVSVEGKEIEVQVMGSLNPASPAPQTVRAVNAAPPVDIEAIKAETIKVEREYRKAFTTAVCTANLSPTAADKFETDFYGRPIADIKFLASNAIGMRAKPVGEGGTGDPPAGAGKPADTKPTSAEAASARWHSDKRLRTMFGVHNDDQSSPQYRRKMAAFVAAQCKCDADQAKPVENMESGVGDDDVISKLLKQPDMFVQI
jgi:ATP-dependent Clp endopeptidase proteolytic subunit ClpP